MKNERKVQPGTPGDSPAKFPRVEIAAPDDSVSRRRFLRTAAGTLAAGAVLPAVPLGAPSRALAETATPPAKSPETLVKVLHDSLKAEQCGVMHFPFDHEKRSRISNNWNIVEPEVGAIGKLYTPDQQEIIRQILRGVLTEDGYERLMKQMGDDSGGFQEYTCALFGEPGDKKFEWVITGRHLTLRVDGNSVENAALGGPIFYGHAVQGREKPGHPGNVWWHQGELANNVFQALDGKQREKALLSDAPPDSPSTLRLRGHEEAIPGLAGADLSADQRGLFEGTLKSLLGMFRPSDVDEVVGAIKKNGGFEKLHVSYYKQGDIGDDGVWDIWRVEGPAFVWFFRGSPHVHVWVNVADHA